ncbi:PREDICTED: cornifelin [Condylura cristata]|uniref:cornifelin n=1 Tax=Condylura cristata TaxID=143302 RepID=UPI0003347A6B|nr:PREDICTED: cornifelin [Condylura cristata]
MQYEMHDRVKGKAMSYPVTTQPQCASNNCYQTQSSDWHTGLTDCCNDMPICECPCPRPLQPEGSGSVGQDWAALTFCLPCALCQMARELKIRE